MSTNQKTSSNQSSSPSDSLEQNTDHRYEQYKTTSNYDGSFVGNEYSDTNKLEGKVVGVEEFENDEYDDLDEDENYSTTDDQANLANGAESTGRWTKQEHELFLEALNKYGKEWKRVAGVVKTRTVVQTRTHAQKYFQKLNKSHEYIDSLNTSKNNMDYVDDMPLPNETNSKRSGRQIENHPTSILKDSKSYPYSSKKSSKAENHRSLIAASNNDSNQSSYYDTQDYYDSIDLATIVSELHKTPANDKEYITIPPPNYSADFPQPSPAACGKRKHAEMAAAQMLAASSSANRRNDSSILDGNNSNSKNRLGLVLTIQDTDPPFNSYDDPGTPWDTAMRALENRYVNFPTKMNRSSSFSAYNIPPVPVSTPSEQRLFISKVRSFIHEGDLAGLTSLLSAAEFSAQTYVENSGEKDINKTDDLGFETTSVEKQRGTVQFEGYVERQDSFESVSNLMSVYTPDVLMSNKFAHPFHPLSTEDMSSMKSNSTTYFDRSKLAQKSKSFSLVAQSLNRTDDVKRSILMEIASIQKSNDAILYSMCMLLLEHGASPTLIDAYGNSCLHYAAKFGSAHIGRLLLTRGCPLNLQNNEGDAATHIAAKAGYPVFFEMLADLGANFHLRNGSSLSALDLVGYSSDNKNQRNEMRKIMLTAEPRLRSLVLYHEDFLEHTARRPSDWEGPDRLEEIMKRLSDKVEFPDYEVEISNNFEKADVILLGRVHSAEYIAFVNMLAKQVRENERKDGNVEDISKIVPFTPQIQRFLLRQPSEELKNSESCDTSFSSGTLNAARRAAGAVAHAVDRVMLGRNRNVFCAVRPPGHHAGFRGLLDGSNSCGFCIFNNIAAGALHALEEHHCERVAIIDIDVHHGNGTEDIVRKYAHPSRLFFFSLHLFDKETQVETTEVTADIETTVPVPGGKYEFYPGTGARDDYIHNIINVPLAPLWAIDNDNNSLKESDKTTVQSKNKSHFIGREGYRQAIEQRLIPSLRAFNPSLILLSIGFDASAGDVGNIRHFTGQSSKIGIDLTPEDYSWTTTEIMKIADICCGGRLVSVLEGGYGEYMTAPTTTHPSKQTATLQAPTTRGANKTIHNPANTSSTLPNEQHQPNKSSQIQSIMNRNILAKAAAAHVHALIDPFGEI